MANYTAADIKALREQTGAGMLDCRAALVGSSGDYDKARKNLIEQGATKAAKKADREAKEGLVGSYIHIGGKIGVLVEINCETDFVARNEAFAELVRDVAMHVAAIPAKYVSRDEVPEADVAAAKQELAKGLEGKPANLIDQIIAGKLNKWYEEHVLEDQTFVKDDNLTIAELVAKATGKLGEKIKIRRFVKFALGQ
ncbi:MAG: translation elongation factor Ts [Vulcanimicrobiaceae bacterium]